VYTQYFCRFTVKDLLFPKQQGKLLSVCLLFFHFANPWRIVRSDAEQRRIPSTRQSAIRQGGFSFYRINTTVMGLPLRMAVGAASLAL
jgi:hypothetical protein